MRILETPGVYFERSDANAGGVAALRTDIAGFVGIARRGPLHLAIPVDSYRQFQAWFGDVVENGYLAYCARAFFENGGRRLWAVRVASEAAQAAALTLRDTLGNAAWRIEASSAGVWGNDLTVRVVEVRRTQARAWLSAHEPRRLHVDSMAGFAPYTLIEVSPAAPQALAVVRELDAVGSTLVVDRDLAALTPGAVLRAETISYTVEVYDAGRLLALFEDLSLIAGHPRYGPAVLKQPWQIVDRHQPDGEPAAASSDAAIQHFRMARERFGESPPPVVMRELRDRAARDTPHLIVAPRLGPPVALAGGADGLAALAPLDFIGEEISPAASDLARAAARRGVRALGEVDEIGLVAIPDIHIQPQPPASLLPAVPCVADPCLPMPPAVPTPTARSIGDTPPRFGMDAIYRVQAAMVAQCERRRDRIALLDAPFEACTRPTFLAAELRAWRGRFDSGFAALYAPWLGVVDPLRMRPGSAARGDRLTRPIPPSGHVAGLYAATDIARGVHVAGANVALTWVQDVSLAIDEERHGILNSLGVNAIRAQPGRGVRLLGARTLCSDTAWRFVNVRRLVSMIAKALEVSLQWAVFEPNDWRTRAKIALVIGSFLQELWSRGALVGAVPAEAYFVRCGEQDNPADARARGELLARIGIAPSVPLEFVVLRIGRDSNGLAVSESEPASLAA